MEEAPAWSQSGGKGKRLLMWDNFVKGDKISKTLFHHATCKACLAKSNDAQQIRGERSQMDRHYYSCKHISEAERETFRKRVRGDDAETSRERDPSPSAKKPKHQSSAVTFCDKPLDRRDVPKLEQKLLEMFVSCNIPFAAVEDPRFVEFVRFLRPAVTLPSRFVMSTRILDTEIAKLNTRTASALQGQKNLTLTMDGFKNARHESVLGVMVVVRNADKVDNVLLSTENIATQNYKAEDVVVKVKDSMKVLKEKHQAEVRAVTCDSEGAHIKARRLMGVKYPDKIFVACNAHQVNLMVKDTVKVIPNFVATTKKAMKVSSTLAKSQSLLGSLREEQMRIHNKTNAISKPTETRWYSFYNTFVAIIKSRVPLQAAALRAANCPAAFSAIVNSDAFWASLNRMVELLGPLVSAQGKAESDMCTLADVEGIVADVFDCYTAAEDGLSAKLLKTLERRWERFYEVPLIVVAMFLDPKTRMRRFRDDPQGIHLALIGKWACALYTRFFGRKPASLLDSLIDYNERTGIFDDGFVADVNSACRFWKLVKPHHREMAELALHLLCVVTHAAAIERGWSQMAYVHSKNRSTMRLSTATALTSMRMRFQRTDREAVPRDVPKAPAVIDLGDDVDLVRGEGDRMEPEDDDSDCDEEITLFLNEQSEVEVMDEGELVETLTDFFPLSVVFGKSP